MLAWCNTAFSRFRALFRSRPLEDELAVELGFHIDAAVDAYVRKGVALSEAHRRAKLDLGGVEQIKESYRERRGLPMIETTLKDLRYGFRTLRRSPGFTITAVLCLTLGIGATTAVLSWIEGILLRP